MPRRNIKKKKEEIADIKLQEQINWDGYSTEDKDTQTIVEDIIVVKKPKIPLNEQVNNVINEIHTNIEVKSERVFPTCNISISTAEDLIYYYNQNTSVIKEKKNKKGEVFTPINLVIEMLDKFPNDIWNDPTLKWLDPSAGIGVFVLIVYMRLMIGLKDKIPDIETRRKHIIENQLFMCELDSENCKILKMIFCNEE